MIACGVFTDLAVEETEAKSSLSLPALKNIFFAGECGVDFAGVPGVVRTVISPVLVLYDDYGSLR